jgi:hypothetical protein
LDVNGTVRIRGGSPQAGYILTSDALGNASWQVPGGSPGIFPGTAKGNTPYWNDTIWVNNSNNLYNNGSKIGIGTNAPAQLFSVKNRMMVDSNGAVKIGAGAMLPNTPFSVNNRMMVDSNGTINFALANEIPCIDVSQPNELDADVQIIKLKNLGDAGLNSANDGFMFLDSSGYAYMLISPGYVFLDGFMGVDTLYSDYCNANNLQCDTSNVGDGTSFNGVSDFNGFIELIGEGQTTGEPIISLFTSSTATPSHTNGFVNISNEDNATNNDDVAIVGRILQDSTQTKGIGMIAEGRKVGLIANAFNSGTSALTHAIEATASNNGTNTGLLVKAKNRGTVSGTKTAINAQATGGSVNNAALMTGDVTISGNLAKGGGTFKIDHPQDPENKYLIHSFVESPDMMNVYNGNIVSDANGVALVALPSYFEVENKDFKYQLTIIDNSADFVMAKVSKKISNNSFEIKTSKPNVEVSWQVTGVRKDKWAEAHRVVPEMEKEARYKGSYLHPELYGKSAEDGILIQMGNEGETPEKK